MAATLEDGKLRLSGYVGDYYFEDGFTSGDVVLALAGYDDAADLEVFLNSGGGIATEGAAIHAILASRQGSVNVVIEGVAASAASLIAMVGERVTMSAGAIMMIHDPSGFTFGTSDAHAKTIEALEAMATAYSRIYAAKSEKTPQACREIMKAERWLSPEDAVAEGFADATLEADATAVAAFDYRLYAHAPQSLVALAANRNWSLAEARSKAAMTAPVAAPPARSNPPKEITMTDKERAEKAEADLAALRAQMSSAGDAAVTADRERRSAIMGLEEAQGREGLAEHLFSTGATVDAAKATLAASPKAAASTSTQPTMSSDAAELERQRLHGAGLGGNASAKFATAAAPSLVANMRKQLGKEPV